MGQGFRIEWDDDKRAANLAKHGIDFVEVDQCFDGRATVIRADVRASYGEPRYNMLAALDDLIVNITFTPRATLYRVISARLASRSERRVFDAHRTP